MTQQHTSLGTAVVTGASAGIGSIYAQRLAARGYDLVLVARRADRLEALAQTLRTQFGVQVRKVVADLGNADDLEHVAHDIASDDSISMLVNNAGGATLAPLEHTSMAAINSMHDLNVTALARLSHAILPRFKLRQKGTLINIASVLGLHTLPISSAYSGTKGYVLNFTRGLQQEVAGTPIIVQLVLPSATATDLWDISGVPMSQLQEGSIMTAEDCVDAALAGLDMGETLTLPSVEDAQLLADYEATRIRLFMASQSGRPATRYGITHTD